MDFSLCFHPKNKKGIFLNQIFRFMVFPSATASSFSYHFILFENHRIELVEDQAAPIDTRKPFYLDTFNLEPWNFEPD